MKAKLFKDDSGWYVEGGRTLRKFTCPIQKMEFQTDNVPVSAYVMRSFLDTTNEDGYHQSFSVEFVRKNVGQKLQEFDMHGNRFEVEVLGRCEMQLKQDRHNEREFVLVQTNITIWTTPEMDRAVGEFYASFRPDGGHCITLSLTKRIRPHEDPDRHVFLDVTGYTLHKV